MNSSEIRAISRENLSGKWGKAVLSFGAFALVSYILSIALAFVPALGPIISYALSIPLSFGFLVTLIKLNNDQEISYFGFLTDGFAKFGKVWSTTLHMALKLIIPVILVIVCLLLLAGSIFTQNDFLLNLSFVLYIISIIYLVYKSFFYTFSLYVLVENPDISGKEAVEKSAELMKGNIWKYICLNLSFIGWIILTFFTLGIGFFWLIPYMKTAEINFYKNISGQI